MQLTVITSEKSVPNELSIVNELFSMGLDRLHIRKPGYAKVDYSEYLTGIKKEYHSRIVLCGAFELYNLHHIGGVHLSSFERVNPPTKSLLCGIPPGAISTSFHSWDEIAACDKPYGRIFISPVFDSISKPGYSARIAPEQARLIKNKFEEKNEYCPEIIGLGGVNNNNINILMQNEFDGAALLGAIWLSANPAAAFSAIKSTVTNLSH